MHSTNLTATATTAPTEIELSRRSQCQDNDLSSREEEGQILTDTVTYPVLSRWKTVTIISTVSGITVLNSMQNGIVTVGLPTIGRDLGLNPSLILWPSSVYSLACGCFLLFTGQMADVLGSRKVFLSGCLLYATFTLLSGLSQTPLQLISFRALQGLSIAACLPSAVGILSLSFPTGSTRNIGFSILGAGQPVGFASGMVLSGVFISKLSWRWAFYCSAIVNLGVFVGAWWGLPRTKVFEPVGLKTFWRRVDWIGAGLVSTSLGLFFYVLAIVADGPGKWVAPIPIAFTVISVVLFPAFLLWERRQEKLQKTCIMPLMVWKNKSFAAVCVAVFMAWAAFNGVQYFAALTFQEVQHRSTTTTSLYFIPCVITGAATNIASGLLVSRVKANHLALAGAIGTMIAPLIMANMDLEWGYWRAAFWAMLFSPLSADVLYTISNLAITSLFPVRTQALAGGVFNTLAQIGNSVGLAVTSIVAASVTGAKSAAAAEGASTQGGILALWEGYKASFWTCFAACVVSGMICAGGMRGLGKVGLKVE